MKDMNKKKGLKFSMLDKNSLLTDFRFENCYNECHVELYTMHMK